MKKLFLLYVATLIPVMSQVSPTAGSFIQVDFGNIEPAGIGWNQFAESDISNGIDDLIDSTNLITTVGVNIIGGTPEDDTVFGDGSAEGGSTLTTVYEDGLTLTGNGNDQFSIEIFGLDPLLEYNLFAGALSFDDSFGAEWTIGSTVEITEFQNTDPYVTFFNITPDSSGTIIIALDDLVNGNANNNPGTGIGIAELTITVIPEPSISLLLGLGFLHIVVRRKREH